MKKMVASPQSMNKDRYAFMFGSLVGRKVVVNLKSLVSFEGVFSGCQNEKGDYNVLLKYARELPSETRVSGSVLEELLIPGKEIVMMSGYDVPEEGALEVRRTAAEFRTDSEIPQHAPSSSSSAAERRLETWGGGVASDQVLEQPSSGWTSPQDQFEVARKMGVVSTYKEDLYTTPLDYSKLTTEQRARAEKLAKEIEGGGRSYAAQEEGDGADEEAAFSAVIGTGGYAKRRVPPAHPSNSASSWRTAPSAPSAANTRLNALNLEPAVPKQAAPRTAVLPQIPPLRSGGHSSSSEMKSINALNLEPASLPRDGPRVPRGASTSTKPTKRDFEIALAEIKSREPTKPLKPATPPVAPKQPLPHHKFSFNPNASTFTPGGPPNPNTLNIVMTPGGSLAGSLKTNQQSYDYYEPAAGPPMVMYPPPPHQFMQHHPLPPPPAFSPLSESVAVFDLKDALAGMAGAAGSSSSWSSSASSTTSGSLKSYKDILGPLPVHPPPAPIPFVPHPPMPYAMMPPYMGGPGYYPRRAPYLYPPPPPGRGRE